MGLTAVGIVAVHDAVEALRGSVFVVPTQAQVDGQLAGDAPIVLEEARGVVLRIEGAARCCSTVAAGRQSQQERGERGADSGAAAVQVVLPRVVAVEIEFRLIADAVVGLLQHPVLAAVTEGVVAVNLRERGAHV